MTCVARQRQGELLERVAQERLASLAHGPNGPPWRRQFWKALTVLTPALLQAAHEVAEAARQRAPSRDARRISEGMDSSRFDALTRTIGRGPATRRAALRLLMGGALAVAMERLALTETEAAKRRKRRANANRDDTLKAEGKKGKGKGKKGKGRGKDKTPPRDCSPGKRSCPDGECVHEALCCPGQRMCGDGSCQTGCCADEWECPGGACIDPLEECCPGQRRCDGNVCIPEDECCPEAAPPLCTDECEDIACRNGELVCELVAGCEPPPPCEDTGPCRPGHVRNAQCHCVCPSGSGNCGGWCCSDGLYCNPGDNWLRLCRTADWQLSCPLGYSDRGDGFCTV